MPNLWNSAKVAKNPTFAKIRESDKNRQIAKKLQQLLNFSKIG